MDRGHLVRGFGGSVAKLKKKNRRHTLIWPQNAGHPISDDLNCKNLPDTQQGTAFTGLHHKLPSLKSCMCRASQHTL